MVSCHPDWAIGFEDECWLSRFEHPSLSSWVARLNLIWPYPIMSSDYALGPTERLLYFLTYFTGPFGCKSLETYYDQKCHCPCQYHNQNKRSGAASRFRADQQGTRPGIDGSMEQHDQKQAVA